MEHLTGGFAQIGEISHPRILLEGGLSLDAPAVSASSLLKDVSLTAPFVFTGNLTGRLSRPFGLSPPPLFKLDFTGHGTALASFTRPLQPTTPTGGPLLTISSATYQFEPVAPVPEPAPGPLICLGLAAWPRRRRMHGRGSGV